MSLLCYVQPRCMARLSCSVSQPWKIRSTTTLRFSQASLSSLRTLLSIDLPPRSIQSVATFSTYSRLEFPRKKTPTPPRSSNYLGFRNESSENRYVREHNLFNPSLYHAEQGNSTKRENGRKRTTTLSITETDVADLEREMIWFANHSAPGARLVRLLHHLTVTRRVRPNILHYEALILLNASPEYGSAKNVKMLLEEMQEYKIPASSTIYTAVLRVMTVHPDPDILAYVMKSCSKMWIEIDFEMLHLISAANLRAGMIEQALDYLEQIETTAQTTGNEIELWLYVLFIRELAVAGDWEAVMRMCYRLNDDPSLGIPLAMRQVDVPHEFWHWLLEQAAGAGDVWVTTWIWKLWVVKQWIRPQPELCMQLLEVVADAGVSDVAESVSGYLTYMIPGKDAHDIDPAVNATWTKDEERIRKLVAKAYRNSGTDAATADAQREFNAFRWQVLAEDQHTPSEFAGNRSFDPWALLDESTDPGRSWPRILRERQEQQERLEMKREISAAGWARHKNKE